LVQDLYGFIDQFVFPSDLVQQGIVVSSSLLVGGVDFGQILKSFGVGGDLSISVLFSGGDVGLQHVQLVVGVLQGFLEVSE